MEEFVVEGVGVARGTVFLGEGNLMVFLPGKEAVGQGGIMQSWKSLWSRV